MKVFLQSRIAASVVLATGAALLLFGFVRAGALDAAQRQGVFEIGHVTAASDAHVTLSYERHGEQHTVVAYPTSPTDFAVGDVIEIQVVLEGGKVAVIGGTENSTGFYVLWLGLGGVVALGGFIWLLRLWRAAPTVPPLPPIEYAGHRHGGA